MSKGGMPKAVVALFPTQQTADALDDLFQHRRITTISEDDTSDVSKSSATQKQLQKSKRKRKIQESKDSKPKEMEPLEPIASHTYVARLQDEVEIFDFADLFKQHPEMFDHLEDDELKEVLGMDIDAPSNSSSSSSNTHAKRQEKRRKAVQAMQKQRDKAQVQIEIDREHPFLLNEFKQMVKHLPNPAYVLPLSLGQSSVNTNEIIEILRQRLLYLPVLTAEFESELLQEAGHFRHPRTGRVHYFPPCKNGDKCVNNTMFLPGHETLPNKQGFICMMSMTPREHERILTEDVAPLVSRACRNCDRLYGQKFVYTQRSVPHLVRVGPDFAFQLYRNLCDCEGGYYSQYTVSPEHDRWEGFFDKFVEFRHSYFRLYVQGPECGGRARCNQDLLIWKPLPVLTPELGESQRDFQQRSLIFVREYNGGSSSAFHESRMAQRDPRRVLLRVLPQADRTPMTPNLLDSYLRYLDQMYEQWRQPPPSHPPPPPSATAAEIANAYEVTVTLDSGRKARGARTSRSMVLADCLCEETVRDMDQTLARCCFWSNTKGKSDKRVHIISKLLPQRCLRRHFNNVCIRYMQADPDFRNSIVGWFVCGLLGNYRLVPHHQRPSIEERLAVYRIYDEAPRSLWQKMVKIVPDVMVWMLRLYLVYSIEDRPALCQNVALLFSWTRFKELTIKTSHELRRILLEQIMAFDAHYTTAADHPLFTAAADQAWVKKVQNLCGMAHEQVLKVAYQRARKPLFEDLFNVCRKFMPKDKHPPNLVTALEGPARAIDAGHMEPLLQFVRTLDPLTINTVRDVIMPMSAFGLNKDAINALIALNQAYEYEHGGKRVMENTFHALITKHPRAFALLMAFSRLWRATHWVQVRPLPVHYLQYQVAALRERYQLGDETPLTTHDTTFYFCQGCRGVYSLVVPARNRKCKHKEVKCKICHKPYEYGLDCAVTDLFTGKVYCSKAHYTGTPEETYWKVCAQSNPREFISWVRPGSAPEEQNWYVDEADDDDSPEPSDAETSAEAEFRNSRTGRWLEEVLPEHVASTLEVKDLTEVPQIERQELTGISMLGVIICINKKEYFLCPQQGCGRKAEYAPQDCAYTERGYACSRCTDKIRMKQLVETLPPLAVPTPERNVCGVCNNVIKNPLEAVCYPGGVLLCKRHHSNRIQTVVSLWLDQTPAAEVTHDSVVRFIVATRQQFAQLDSVLNSKRNQAILKASRARSRARKSRGNH